MNDKLVKASVTGLFPAPAEFDAMRSAAALVSTSDAIRPCFRRSVGNCFLAALAARTADVGFDVALTRGYTVSGKAFQWDTEVALGIVRRKVPTFYYKVTEIKRDDKGFATSVAVSGGLRGEPEQDVVFTAEMAKAAGLEGYAGPYAEDKLLWRCLIRLIRRTTPEALIYASGLGVEDGDAPGLEPSSAEVVDERSRTGREQERAVDRAAESGEQAASAAVAAASSVPADQVGTKSPKEYQLELLALMAENGWCGGKKPDPKKLGAYMKAHGDDVVRVAGMYYESVGLPKPEKFLAIPPYDFQRILEWLRVWADKKKAGEAGKDAPAVATDSAPAEKDPTPADGDAPPAEAELPDDGPPIGDSREDYEALADGGINAVTDYCRALELSAKGAEPFVKDYNGRLAFVNAAICGSLGSTKDGKPVGMWMDAAVQNQPVWIMLCRALVERGRELGVGVQR